MTAPQKLGLYQIGEFQLEIYKAVQFGNSPNYYWYELNGKKTTLDEAQFQYLKPVTQC